jgi:alkylated DNA repair dioxygenase AlkB
MSLFILGWDVKSGALYRKRPYVPAPGVFALHQHLLLDLKWETKRSAREEYFMSEVPRTYSYGNKSLGDMNYESKPFTGPVALLQESLNMYLSEVLESPVDFNVCFLNKYNDQHNALGWHADDFPGMRADQPIAVLSFGAEREIWVKPKDQKGITPPDQRFSLADGSLFVMPAGYQETHLHKIPKCDHACGWRISLTFRSFK